MKTLFHIGFAPLLLFLATSLLSAPLEPDQTIRELNFINKTWLAKQRTKVDELTRRHFGIPIRGNKSDLHILQRVLDKNLIEKDDKERLQALGVVLGDVYVDDVKALQWKVLEDKQGRSHVVCIKNTAHCLFPVTMLSRRIEGGLAPKVERVYKHGLEQINDYLPKLPFQK